MICPQMVTDIRIQKSKSAEKTYRLYDQDGLYLEVAAAGGKYGRLKYRLAVEEERAAFAVYPAITFAAAREGTLIARERVAAGANPIAARRADRLAATGLDPFEALACEWHGEFSPVGQNLTNTRYCGGLKSILSLASGLSRLPDTLPPRCSRSSAPPKCVASWRPPTAFAR